VAEQTAGVVARLGRNFGGRDRGFFFFLFFCFFFFFFYQNRLFDLDEPTYRSTRFEEDCVFAALRRLRAGRKIS